jgi:hypothetical protein
MIVSYDRKTFKNGQLDLNPGLGMMRCVCDHVFNSQLKMGRDFIVRARATTFGLGLIAGLRILIFGAVSGLKY